MAGMIFAIISGLFGCGGGTKKPVASVEAVTLTVRGMRGGFVYKFEAEDDRSVLLYYREVYAGEKNELVLEGSAPCGADRMTELMNSCGVIRWDGFHGKHPKNVRDGIMFTFTATVNGELTIRAEGSENFPSGYREFVQALNSMLKN